MGMSYEILFPFNEVTRIERGHPFITNTTRTDVFHNEVYRILKGILHALINLLGFF
jgi:hypothetical protein